MLLVAFSCHSVVVAELDAGQFKPFKRQTAEPFTEMDVAISVVPEAVPNAKPVVVAFVVVTLVKIAAAEFVRPIVVPLIVPPVTVNPPVVIELALNVVPDAVVKLNAV